MTWSRYDLKVPGCPHLKALVGDARWLRRCTADFVGRYELPPETLVRLVNVRHPHFGTLRRYVYVIEPGPEYTLRVRKPCFTGTWSEMDQWVSKLFNGAPVHSYSVAVFGALSIHRSDH